MKQIIICMNDTEYCAIKATPEKYKTLAHKILDRGTLVKTGHWIKVTNGRGGHECDICHEYAPSYQDGDEYLTKYCSNCGARMVDEQERRD